MNDLLQTDKWLFEKINSEWTHPFLDLVMPIFTDLHRFTEAKVVLLLLLVFFLVRMKKKALRPLAALVLCLSLSDSLTSHLIKPIFERERPNLSHGISVRWLTHPHSGLSFPSNHATNSFAGAVVLSHFFPSLKIAFYLIAAAVGYSRVYVGVHYPSDVLGGAVLGIGWGYLSLFIFSRLEMIVRKKKNFRA